MHGADRATPNQLSAAHYFLSARAIQLGMEAVHLQLLDTHHATPLSLILSKLALVTLAVDIYHL